LFAGLSDILLDGTYVFVAKESINTTAYKELVSNLRWAIKKLHISRVN